MKGLSITAIGLRSFADCLDIFHTLKPSLKLDYLELAIGSKCEIDSDYQDIPLILHDSCLCDRIGNILDYLWHFSLDCSVI